MRADVYLTEQGDAPSRQRARTLIEGGRVTVDGVTLTKPAQSIGEGAHEVTVLDDLPYVGRGGLKLEAALDAFAIKASGLTALDIGASTGGFTDCLLKRGAASVVAIDAGYGQLHESLRADKRVINIEHFNARELCAQTVGELCDVATADVSFISQTYIIDGISSVLKDGGCFISLIKPQFEAGRQGIGKGGIVTSAAYRYLAVKRVINFAVEHGFDCVGLIRSPIEGGDGNIEYLACFVKKTCVKPKIDDKTILLITKRK